MKGAFLTAVTSCLAVQATSKPCPFSDMKERGLLSGHESSMFDMVKRDPSMAERFLAEHRLHHKRAIDEAADIAPRQNSSGGLLGSLPLGGGLRT